MIDRDFFTANPVRCARGLIGARLVWEECAGIIVETEAYDEEGDPACHTFFRPSARAFVEENAPGTAYVYMNYGVHWLLNVLVKGKRRGFVLIRAVEPIEGIAEMAARRGMNELPRLCSGPGRLTQAMGIDGAHHGIDLCGDQTRSFQAHRRRAAIVADGRIGISVAADLPWRFTLAESPFVSRRVVRR